MARSVTVSNLILWIRTEAGMSGSTAITDAEIVAMLNSAWPELYDMLVAAYGPAFYATKGDLSTVAGQKTYAWPTIAGVGATCYQILGVDLAYSATEVVELETIDFDHRNLGMGPTSWQSRRQKPYYRWHGSEIWLMPPPDGVYTVTVHWVPSADVLTAASTIDGINGWERYLVAWCLARIAEAEETDPSPRYAELAKLEKRIAAMANNRQADGPDQVVKRRGRRAGWGVYGDD